MNKKMFIRWFALIIYSFSRYLLSRPKCPSFLFVTGELKLSIVQEQELLVVSGKS